MLSSDSHGADAHPLLDIFMQRLQIGFHQLGNLRLQHHQLIVELLLHGCHILSLCVQLPQHSFTVC